MVLGKGSDEATLLPQKGFDLWGAMLEAALGQLLGFDTVMATKMQRGHYQERAF